MKHLWTGLAAILAAACATPTGESERWTQQNWASQAMRTVSGGPFSFAAMPYGDGFQLKLSIKTGAVGISSANESLGETPPTEAQLQEAAQAAAPAGCSVKSVSQTPDGAVADYDCP